MVVHDPDHPAGTHRRSIARDPLHRSLSLFVAQPLVAAGVREIAFDTKG
jgi:hypothetical protein